MFLSKKEKVKLSLNMKEKVKLIQHVTVIFHNLVKKISFTTVLLNLLRNFKGNIF